MTQSLEPWNGPTDYFVPAHRLVLDDCLVSASVDRRSIHHQIGSLCCAFFLSQRREPLGVIRRSPIERTTIAGSRQNP